MYEQIYKQSLEPYFPYSVYYAQNSKTASWSWLLLLVEYNFETETRFVNFWRVKNIPLANCFPGAV